MDAQVMPDDVKPAEMTAVSFRGLLRKHAFDWIQVVIGAIILGCLQLVQPFQRFVDQYTLQDNAYPHGGDTVPASVVPLIALAIPMTVFFCVFIAQRRKAELHYANLGLWTTIIWTALITEALKLSVGRPRPDFLFRCFPSGKPVFALNGDVVCNGIKHVIKDGRKSFPSGHSSWSFAGMGYLSLYMAGKLKVFNSHEGRTSAMLACALPLAGATAVGISRLDDYMHHWTDIVAGGSIGFGCAWLIYRQHFPPLKDNGTEVYPNSYDGVELPYARQDIEIGAAPNIAAIRTPPGRNS